MGVCLNQTINQSTSQGNLIRPKEEKIFHQKLLELSILFVIGLLAVLGNALVAFAFFKGNRRLRTKTNCFVVNLAVSDFLVGCLSVPFWMCVELGLTNVSTEKVFITLDVLFGSTSILSLVAISIERLFAVKYPTRHMNFTHQSTFLIIFFTWAIAILIVIIHIISIKVGMKVTTTVIFCLAFVLPSLVIIGSYSLLFTTVCRLTRADNHDRTLRREVKIAKMLAVIIGLFLFCWAPFFLINILYVYWPNASHSWPIMISVTKILHYSNSMMNIFVYAVRSPDFREAFKILLFRKCGLARTTSRTISFSLSHERTLDRRYSRRSTNQSLKFSFDGTSDTSENANAALLI